MRAEPPKSSVPAANTFAPFASGSRPSGRSAPVRRGRDLGEHDCRRRRVAASSRRSRSRSRRRTRRRSSRSSRCPPTATGRRAFADDEGALVLAPRRSRGTARRSAPPRAARSRHGAVRVSTPFALDDPPKEVVRRQEHQVPAGVAVLLDHVVLVVGHVLACGPGRRRGRRAREVAARPTRPGLPRRGSRRSACARASQIRKPWS